MKAKLLFIIALFATTYIHAQGEEQQSNHLLDEVVVTATRTENKVRNLPLPIQVISGKAIRQSGSESLLDVLQMQTGIVLAANPMGVSLQGYPNPFGAGIQMQGMDPAYTLILIDGEPVIGRNGGVLDMSRIAVGDIKQIEILRGPATSLYGSDALAGVINIITSDPIKNSLQNKLHYGSNNEQAISLSGNLKLKKTLVRTFARCFSNDGWDYSKDIYGKTIDPVRSYALNAKTITNINDKNTLTFSGKYYHQKVFNDYQITTAGDPEIVTGNTIEGDKSIYGKWHHLTNNRLSYIASIYATGYQNVSHAYLKKNDSLYDKITLHQFLLKPEFQVNIGKESRMWVAGAGYNYETINSNRYSDRERTDLGYAYVQKQWTFTNSLNLISGLRFDKHTHYPSQISPKVAAAYKLNPDFIIKGSVGTGFKTPDFRQLYLDYSNSLVGYTILGALELGHGLDRLQKNGLIPSSVNITPYQNGQNLVPEKSMGMNIGFDYSFDNKGVFKLNFFRNDISNLIETYSLPFLQTNKREIFSYTNLNKIFTQGAELNLSYRISKNFLLNTGYNYLDARDKQVIRDIKAQKIYRRDPDTDKSTIVKLSDYKGLYNRSKHSANANLRYSNLRYKANIVLNTKYRGRYGFQGVHNYADGNEILDDPREFVNGFALIDLILNKEIGTYYNIQAGVNNILNYIQPTLMPSQFGRSYFININLSF